jgi:hypothetical protein
MKKAPKPPGKRPAQKQPVAYKTSAKPKLKAQEQFEVAPMIARLDAIADKLALAVDRLAQLHPSGPNPTGEALRSHTDEHADDVKVAGSFREE